MATCSIFCAVEVSDRPFQVSLFGRQEPSVNHSRALNATPSVSSWTSESTSGLRKQQSPHRFTDTSLSAFDHAHWLRRRNSLSSQRAIFPSNFPLSDFHSRSDPSFNLN